MSVALEPVPPPRPLEVLLVEESPTDAMLAREALEDTHLHMSLHTVTDGVEALAFVRREGRYQKGPRPDLVLLDLNLPRKRGTEVLREIMRDAVLRTIPVVILTPSAAPEDILEAYALHANGYVIKSADFSRFTDVVRSMEPFWCTVAALPPAG